jgi:hypothetical protein
MLRHTSFYMLRTMLTHYQGAHIGKIQLLTYGKVKCTLEQPLRLCTGRTAHRGSRGIALLFHDHGTIRGLGVSFTLRPLFTPGKIRYPLYRRLGGPQGRSGQLRKISPPPGFDPRTVQPVASHYTDWATWPIIVNLLDDFYLVGSFRQLLAENVSNCFYKCALRDDGPVRPETYRSCEGE